MARIVRLASLGFIVSLLLLSPGSAQPVGSPDFADPYRTVVVTAPSAYWGYVRSPYAEALFGTADLIRANAELTRANADYHYRIQEAIQQRQVSRREKIKTRKEELEHIRWERTFRFEMQEEERKRMIKFEEDRARERPPTTEILSGRSLNILVDILKKETSSDTGRSSQPLKQEWLDNLNITATTGGNAGLLRQKSLSWPALLQEDRFATIRGQFERLLEQSRQDARAVRLSGQTVKELIEVANRIDSTVIEEVNNNDTWSPRHFIQARRFTHELKQTVLLLENPKDAAFLLGHLPPCKTVAQLVQYMRENGLRFAPASAGSERHYVGLHAALAAEVGQRQR